jgi:hypothetical protein
VGEPQVDGELVGGGLDRQRSSSASKTMIPMARMMLMIDTAVRISGRV